MLLSCRGWAETDDCRIFWLSILENNKAYQPPRHLSIAGQAPGQADLNIGFSRYYQGSLLKGLLK